MAIVNSQAPKYRSNHRKEKQKRMQNYAKPMRITELVNEKRIFEYKNSMQNYIFKVCFFKFNNEAKENPKFIKNKTRKKITKRKIRKEGKT